MADKEVAFSSKISGRGHGHHELGLTGFSQVNRRTHMEERNFGQSRRTQRVQITIPVLIRGKSENKSFEEETETIAVNAHGCEVLLKTQVVQNQQLWLVHRKTAEELPSTVVYLGKQEPGKTRAVGIAFGEPSPLFWRISFPPDDWESSSERKRREPTRPASPSKPDPPKP
jgi:hypothetical protein